MMAVYETLKLNSKPAAPINACSIILRLGVRGWQAGNSSKHNTCSWMYYRKRATFRLPSIPYLTAIQKDFHFKTIGKLNGKLVHFLVVGSGSN